MFTHTHNVGFVCVCVWKYMEPVYTYLCIREIYLDFLEKKKNIQNDSFRK